MLMKVRDVLLVYILSIKYEITQMEQTITGLLWFSCVRTLRKFSEDFRDNKSSGQFYKEGFFLCKLI